MAQDDRSPHQHLEKIPKYAEANTLPVAGFGAVRAFGRRRGRFPHSDPAEHRPGWLGRGFLWLLGMRHGKGINDDVGNNESGTLPQLSR